MQFLKKVIKQFGSQGGKLRETCREYSTYKQSSSYDVIVVGIGGMGSSILYHLSKKGLNVLGLDRFQVGHQQGSSHGLSRIYRLIYLEGSEYVPILKRAYQLWNELQEQTHLEILKSTGSLDIGDHFERVLECAKMHHLDHEVFTATEANVAFPGLQLPQHFKALYSPHGLVLYPEQCIAAHLNAAKTTGRAQINHQEAVNSWSVLPDGTVEVQTNQKKYQSQQLILSVGPWIEQFVPEMKGVGLCVAERQVVVWFKSSDDKVYQDDYFPVFIISDQDGCYYGFPKTGGQDFKIGKMGHRNQATLPDAVDRKLYPEDTEVLQAAIDKYFPAANGGLLSYGTCMFTNSPDQHFIIDKHPIFNQVHICSPCSGHGFKFCSVIGEYFSDVVSQGWSIQNFDMFAITQKRSKHFEEFMQRCYETQEQYTNQKYTVQIDGKS